jgi:hypothetical protein
MKMLNRRLQLSRLLRRKLNAFITGKQHAFFIEKATEIEPLPETPYRGLERMYNVRVPHLSLEIDFLLDGIIRYLGCSSANNQYNIDAFDEQQWSDALPFHYDRAAEFTLLAGLRGAENKFTVVISFHDVLDLMNESDRQILCKPYFYAFSTQLKETVSNLTIFINDAKSIFALHPDIYTHQLELADVFANTPIASTALENLRNLIARLDLDLLSKEIYTPPTIYKKFNAKAYGLQAGDILILRNAYLLHGRTAGHVIDIKQNRWLKTIFVSG